MSIQYFLPQRLSSWVIRKLTRIKVSWFKNTFIKNFAKLYKVNWDESLLTQPEDFESFNDFFTRALKPSVRPINDAPLIAPADGKIAAFGQLQNTQFLHAKGHHFSLENLIADPSLAHEFKGGLFSTIYLSPRDYHRIHMPIRGKLLKTIHIPGKLYSVSLKTAEAIPSLFAENERVVCVFETHVGKIILVLVGAINVSSIETIWSGTITPPYGKFVQYTDYTAQEITLEKGEEMGRFNMGSTVILITETSDYPFHEDIVEMGAIKMGAALLK